MTRERSIILLALGECVTRARHALRARERELDAILHDPECASAAALLDAYDAVADAVNHVYETCDAFDIACMHGLDVSEREWLRGYIVGAPELA